MKSHERAIAHALLTLKLLLKKLRGRVIHPLRQLLGFDRRRVSKRLDQAGNGLGFFGGRRIGRLNMRNSLG